jgi:hypothetical protein
MSGESAHLITHHRCSTQEWELHKRSSDDSWQSSSKHVSDTSSVSARADLIYDLVTDIQQVPQQYMDLQRVFAFLPRREIRRLLQDLPRWPL